MICSKGINDMPKGWTKASEWNYRVYRVWCDMLKRCYSEKYHRTHSSYKECYTCERWLKLSGFVEDIVKIPNYEYWLNNPKQRISLDKDKKSNCKNKCYCLEQCQFISCSENSKMNKGENHPRAMLVDRYDLNMNYIDTDYTFNYEKKYGFNHGAIFACCRGKRKTHKGYTWRYHEN